MVEVRECTSTVKTVLRLRHRTIITSVHFTRRRSRADAVLYFNSIALQISD